jgi:hypothetical protein
MTRNPDRKHLSQVAVVAAADHRDFCLVDACA